MTAPLPPLPRRVRRWTVTRPALADALAVVYPLADRESVEDLAGEILGHLPPALSLTWPVGAAPVPVPDHECSFLLSDGICKHPGCGKTWERNVAELNLDRALREFAATEPAPAREGDGLAGLADEWLAIGRTAPMDDAALLGRLGTALAGEPGAEVAPAGALTAPGASEPAVPVSLDPEPGKTALSAGARAAVREALLRLDEVFTERAASVTDSAWVRIPPGEVRRATFGDAALEARARAGRALEDPGTLGRVTAGVPAAQDGTGDLRAPSDDPWIPADGAGRDTGRAL